MARYVDGFITPVPKKNVAAYRRMARKAGRIWREHGALEFIECVGEDLDSKETEAFPKALKVKRGETIMFSWVVYKSRRHRDRVIAKVLSDPRMLPMMNPKTMPFDAGRMLYGGFKVLVDE